jgi:hypothetical protein
MLVKLLFYLDIYVSNRIICLHWVLGLNLLILNGLIMKLMIIKILLFNVGIPLDKKNIIT